MSDIFVFLSVDHGKNVGLPSESDIPLATPVSLRISLLINPENHWSDVLTMMLWHMGYQN